MLTLLFNFICFLAVIWLLLRAFSKSSAFKERHDNPVLAVLTGIADLVRGKGVSLQLSQKEREKLSTRVCLVTGANSGIGKAVAEQLALTGAKVILACRSGIPQVGEEMKKKTKNPLIEMRFVDLSKPKSIYDFCDGLKREGVQLDCTILNAGCATLGSRVTDDGLDLMFAVNYFANFVLVKRLLESGVISNTTFAEIKTEKALPRIVFVSSEAHRIGSLDLEQLGRIPSYSVKDTMKHYGSSKLAQCTFANTLSRKLIREDGSPDVLVHSLCPGPVDTNIGRDAPGWIQPVLKLVFKLFFLTPTKSTVPILYLAGAQESKLTSSPAETTGVYLHMCKEKKMDERVYREEVGAKLYEKSLCLLKDLEQKHALLAK